MRTLCLLFMGLATVRPTASAGELTAKEIVSAQKIYVAKCAKCHRFYEPTNYAASAWQTWMEKMNKKSKLKGEQASLLTRYLDDYRADRLAGKPQDKATSTVSGAAAR